jgi:transposase
MFSASFDHLPERPTIRSQSWEDDIVRVAPPVRLDQDQASRLKRLSSGRLQTGVANRARIVLLAAEGLCNKEIAREMGIDRETAARWRNRFLGSGIAGLERDAPRPGRTRTITDRQVKQVVSMTMHQKPINTSRWTTRTIADAVGISDRSVRRIWHENGLQPHRGRGLARNA